MKIISQFDETRQLLADGKIIAYPTESVYGLGCDPFNQLAVKKIIALKQRPSSKGFIILIADWSQLTPLIGDVPEHRLDAVRATWPGPVTWIFPPAKIIPDWLSGQHNSIAIRMSAHPVARELCAMGPIISTSANISGDAPAIDVAEVCAQFPYGVDGLVAGELGGNNQLSAIYDVLNGRCLR